ncbi:TerB family tellurite resistance protein [Psychromonas aquimarina]|uniref:tellurite resistance TerB family protein n=1 Tax=Psychromonas aquimarina TaxID=444919 RepID=UPI00041A3903|nr:TerB family tellurite resistance protein [Psychromonas aquimarina]
MLELIFILIITAAGLAGIIEGNKFHKKKVKNTILRGMQKQSSQKQQIQQNKIHQLDKHFSTALISSRVEHAFYIIKQAWSEQDISSARAFISDGISESFQIQFEIQKKQNRRRRIKNLTISCCELVGVEADKHFETLHFKITSRAGYPVEQTGDNKHTDSQIPLTVKTEYLTYVRLPGVQTRTQPGLIEGSCPNCGSTLQLSQSAQCQACLSLVSSGEYDWILAKITQEAQWRFQNAKRQISGVCDYQVVDPAFNIPLIEDRVSSVFWRLQKAWLMQDSAPLLSVAHPSYIEKFNQQSSEHFFDNVQLGLCEVSKVQFAEEFDKVYLLVKWQGNKVSHKGKMSAAAGYYAHHLTMIRKSGVKSDIKKGLHSLHCYGCGAPQSDNYQDCCEYCGSRFNQGEQDWILQDFTPHLEHIVKIKGQEFAIAETTQIKSDRIFDPVSLLSGLVLVLFADGRVDDQEKQLLEQFVKNRRIPQQVLDGIIQAAENGQLDMLTPDETLDASDWLDKLIEMCLADGQVCTEERKLLLQFGEKFNILAIDINLRIKRKRQQLYQQNRQTLKSTHINN